jgi:hypothetical protein
VFEPIPPLRDKVRGWLPEQLEQVLYQCLAKEPDHRPDARELAKTLSRIEIPAEHAWTEDMAQRWWTSLGNAPSASMSLSAAEATVPDGGHVLVPQRATTQQAATPDREARTIEARPSSRNI